MREEQKEKSTKAVHNQEEQKTKQLSLDLVQQAFKKITYARAFFYKLQTRYNHNLSFQGS